MAETSRLLFPNLRFCIVSFVVFRLGSKSRRAVSRSFLLLAYSSCYVRKDWQMMGRGDYPGDAKKSEPVTMTTRKPDTTPAHTLRAELARKIPLFVGSAESCATKISGLSLHRHSTDSSLRHDL
jgi:hypothetical protein